MSSISLKDEKTKRAYDARIKTWENFLAKRNTDLDYIPTDKRESIDVFQLFINWYATESWNPRTKKNGHAPNSVWNTVSSVRKYLYYRGAPIIKDDMGEITLPRKNSEELRGLKLGEIHEILNSFNYIDRVMFMFQICTGMRIGEIIQLRKKHLNFDLERITVKIPAAIAKFGKSRTTFVTKEVEPKLKTVLKKIDDDDLIFGTHKNPLYAESTKIDLLRRHLVSLNLDQRYETGNFQISSHSFRSYFITKVSRHDQNLAKMFAGQKGYLLQYDRLSDDEKLEEYLDFESDLYIFDLTRKDEEIKNLKIARAEITAVQEENKNIKEENKSIREELALVREFYSKSRRVE